MKTERYFLDQDNDSHWYVVPASKVTEWNDWLHLDSDDERSWDAPDWVVKLGGSYTLVKFADFVLEG